MTASYAPEWADGIPGGPPDALALRRAVLSRELCDGRGVFPDADADAAFHRDPVACEWPANDADILSVDAPGGISFRIASRIAPGAPASVSLRWRPTDDEPRRAADATLTALPGPPKLERLESSLGEEATT